MPLARSLSFLSRSHSQAKEKSAEQGEAKTFFSLLFSFLHSLIFHRKFLIGPFSTEFAHRGACRIKKKVMQCLVGAANANCARPPFSLPFKEKESAIRALWLKIMAAFADYALHFSAQYTQGNFIFASCINIITSLSTNSKSSLNLLGIAINMSHTH